MREINRKAFIQTASLATAGMLMAPVIISNSNTTKLKAVAFDAFAIFDPRPIFKAVEELFPEKAKQIVEIWQSRQFTYQWLRKLGKKYKTFMDVTTDALDFALMQCDVSHHQKERDLILAKYDEITTWPDVVPALEQIKKENLTVCFLSNMTAQMLHRGTQNSGIGDFIDYAISTDEKQTYKPGTDAYQMAIDKLRLEKHEILFVPFAAWDMAGSKWFGYSTFWLNRLNAPPENLDAKPDGQGKNLDDVVDFVRQYNKK